VGGGKGEGQGGTIKCDVRGKLRALAAKWKGSGGRGGKELYEKLGPPSLRGSRGGKTISLGYKKEKIGVAVYLGIERKRAVEGVSEMS